VGEFIPEHVPIMAKSNSYTENSIKVTYKK